MSQPYQPPKRTWPQKLAAAMIGIRDGMRGQTSFSVHVVMSLLVVSVATIVGANRVDWCLLLICITLVWSAELMNSALETLAKAIDSSHNEHLKQGLDIASGAVLSASIGAALVGLIVLGWRIAEWLGWIGGADLA